MSNLDELRNDAVECLEEMLYLTQSGRATQEQVTMVGKFFVTALARYTLACADARG